MLPNWIEIDTCESIIWLDASVPGERASGAQKKESNLMMVKNAAAQTAGSFSIKDPAIIIFLLSKNNFGLNIIYLAYRKFLMYKLTGRPTMLKSAQKEKRKKRCEHLW